MPASSVDLRALAQRLDEASRIGIERASVEVVRVYAEKIKNEAQSLAPVKSGRLKYSISIRYVDEKKAIIGPSVFYGAYQEYGTGTRGEFSGSSYTITPKTGSYLTFQVNGKWVRTKMVRHPGIPASPYMRPAVQNSLGEFAQELARTGALQITKGPNG